MKLTFVCETFVERKIAYSLKILSAKYIDIMIEIASIKICCKRQAHVLRRSRTTDDTRRRYFSLNFHREIVLVHAARF